MGGVGKTDLALEAAHRLLGHFKDGVIWQFAGQSSVDDLLNVIAAAFAIKVNETPLPQKKTILQNALANRRVLLVFDNAERSEPISEILDVARTCAIIITSRMMLTLRDTFQINLTELPLPGAVDLFKRSVGRDLTPTEHAFAEEICMRVGRLPLAIVLAAKQVEINRIAIDRLKHRIDEETLNVLRLQLNTNPSVRAAFESTFQSLAPLDQTAFALLGIFSEQGFSLEAMCAVNTDPAAEERLLHLVALSLVKPLGNERYLLHPLLKLFALEKLQDADVYHRMARYYLEFTRQHQTNFDALELERPNILIALDWAQQSGQWSIVVGLVEALLGSDAYYGFLAQRGYWDESVKRVRQALEAAVKLRDGAAEARFSADLGLFYYWQGKNDIARAYYQTALTRFESLGNKRRVIQILHRLGYIEDDEDNYPRARELYKRSLKLSEELGEPDLISLSRHLVGVVAYHEGAYDEARSLMEQSLQEELARGDKADVARTQRRLAAVARMQGHYAPITDKRRYFDEARRLLGESLKTETILRSQARALRQLGMVAQEEGNLDEALKHYSKSLYLFTRLGNRKGISAVKCNLGSVYRERGDYEQAEQLCRESLAIARELQCRYGEALTLRQLGWIALGKRDRTTARDLLQQAISILESIHSRHVEEFKSDLNQLVE